MTGIKHIGLILDGNRRFAKRLMLEPYKGHEYGAKKIESLLEWCKELDIKELTLYAFSMQNFNRPKNEFNYLMKIFKDNFEKLKDDKRVYENNIKINVIGRIDLFPEDVKRAMYEIMEKTKDHDKYIINFAMAYGGREEIIDTIKKIGRKIESGEIKPEQITEELIDANLYMKDQPDFIIRTGGDHRTSNFLIWQSNYSEWFFLQKAWPEFEKEDLINCINEFNSRERRFGK
ncbi:MAG: di-trans,poly-cis-decaprenylcistransferase [Nanoarchaeota archaeon]|nr:di-trans,poly-cis-decaprenylcistransferase [Nanoarchaeota archaeon]MBU0963247.1 di-trans,poly-cis-decaprenylcistransferase [Nanoarchaeota archaeon]